MPLTDTVVRQAKRGRRDYTLQDADGLALFVAANSRTGDNQNDRPLHRHQLGAPCCSTRRPSWGFEGARRLSPLTQEGGRTQSRHGRHAQPVVREI